MLLVCLWIFIFMICLIDSKMTAIILTVSPVLYGASYLWLRIKYLFKSLMIMDNISYSEDKSVSIEDNYLTVVNQFVVFADIINYIGYVAILPYALLILGFAFFYNADCDDAWLDTDVLKLVYRVRYINTDDRLLIEVLNKVYYLYHGDDKDSCFNPLPYLTYLITSSPGQYINHEDILKYKDKLCV